MPRFAVEKNLNNSSYTGDFIMWDDPNYSWDDLELWGFTPTRSEIPKLNIKITKARIK